MAAWLESQESPPAAEACLPSPSASPTAVSHPGCKEVSTAAAVPWMGDFAIKGALAAKAVVCPAA